MTVLPIDSLPALPQAIIAKQIETIKTEWQDSFKDFEARIIGLVEKSIEDVDIKIETKLLTLDEEKKKIRDDRIKYIKNMTPWSILGGLIGYLIEHSI